MSHASELQREVQSVIALYNANVKVFNDRNLNIKNIFFNAFDELTRCPVALVVFKDMCILKVQFRNISTAGAIAFLMRLILKASATRWLSNRNSIKSVIDIFEEIIDSLDAIYEKSKDPEIKFVRHALLRHMIVQLASCRSFANK